jgi:plasmid stability protein
MDIATALDAGTIEFLPDGTQVPRPPTALATRAAKHIRSLEAQHQVHLQAIMQTQGREATLLQDLEGCRIKLKELDAELQDLRTSRGTTSGMDSSS